MGKKKSKKTKGKSSLSYDDGNIYDERFERAQTHPQFQKKFSKKSENDQVNNFIGDKDQVDERFQAVFTDTRFSIGGNIGQAIDGVDKYGRKQTLRIEKEGEGSSSHSDKGEDEEINNDKPGSDDDTSSSLSGQKHDNDPLPIDKEDPESRIAYLTALSRGEIEEESSSSEDETSVIENKQDIHSDDDSSTDSTEEDSIYGKAGVLDPTTGDEIEITFDASPFLAICNTEWSHVRAVDLLAIISSFAPPGSVKYIKVYPSDFGIERMEKDKLGPADVWKKRKDTDEIYNRDDDENNSHEIDNNDTGEEREDNIDGDESVTSNEANDVVGEEYNHFLSHVNDGKRDSDFDPEKLREYEASKLKYYFAIAEFTTCDAADAAYKEVDGMEFGHSSTMLDLRSIPNEEVPNIIKDRQLRDEALLVPSNYNPPDFVVNALQKTKVECTWEEGDANRERLLTQYGCGKEAWVAMTEGDDLKAYLASDVSSSDDESDNDINKNKKASSMRKMLGLDSDGSEESVSGARSNDIDNEEEDDDSFFGSDGDDENDADNKQVAFIPGKSNLEEKIRTKLKEKEDEEKELTPWEKHQLKRKEKRKERKRAAKDAKMRAKMGLDQDSRDESDDQNLGSDRPSSKEELDLLLAGDGDEEDERDFNMRDLLKVEKNKNKKLSRKRKEKELASNISGTNFQIDVTDGRFSSVLDGDDARFGIDKTDPQYKETAGMKTLLSEQTKRRKIKRSRTSSNEVDGAISKKPTTTEDNTLSSLVQKIKTNVTKA